MNNNKNQNLKSQTPRERSQKILVNRILTYKSLNVHTLNVRVMTAIHSAGIILLPVLRYCLVIMVTYDYDNFYTCSECLSVLVTMLTNIRSPLVTFFEVLAKYPKILSTVQRCAQAHFFNIKLS